MIFRLNYDPQNSQNDPKHHDQSSGWVAHAMGAVQWMDGPLEPLRIVDLSVSKKEQPNPFH